MPYRFRIASLLTLAVTSLVLAISAGAETSRKPNIVFILADDLGWTDVACYGSKYYVTPNIDKLASQGMRFTFGYTCGPNCAPTRAALMSGQYAPRTGVYTVGSIDRFNWETRTLRPVDNVTQMPLDKILLPKTLKGAGYATAMFGKWHLGDNGPYHPHERGFDEAIVSAGKHFDFETNPKTEYPKGEYLADFLTDHAVDFIKRHKDGPFFVYLPHYAVHAPHQAKQDLIAKFKDKAPVGGHRDPTYAAMIASVDESVGRVMNVLDELNLADNTLLIFASDNGGIGGYQREGLTNGPGGITDNFPLRGGKGMLYEGGVRVPMIFRLPGKIRPGSVCDEPVCTIDFYPTFLQLTGTPAPKDYTLDGVNILPLLTGPEGTKLNRDAIYWHFPGYLGFAGDKWRTTPAGAIRVGDYKLIEFFETGKIELYDVVKDVSQKNDLAQSDPQRAKEMHDKLLAWRKDVGAKMPEPNKPVVGAVKKKKRVKGEDD